MIADGEEADERGEDQAVDEDHHPGALQVLHLRLLDLPVDLGERLFAAHRQNGMAEADEDRDGGDGRPDRALQPAERVVGEVQIAQQRRRRQRAAALQQRQHAPHDQDHDHHGRDLHDPQRIVARLVQALRCSATRNTR